jgi:hypothetical protein
LNNILNRQNLYFQAHIIQKMNLNKKILYNFVEQKKKQFQKRMDGQMNRQNFLMNYQEKLNGYLEDTQEEMSYNFKN